MEASEVRRIYEQTLAGAPPPVHPADAQLRFLLSLVPEDRSAPILDAGCGNGRYAAHLAGLGYDEVDAVDLFARIESDAFRYRQASIDDLPFDDATFEFAFSSSVIFYLPDPVAAMRELGRVLKRGGVLLLTAHTRYSTFTLWRQIELMLGAPSVRHLVGVPFYSAGEYRRMLAASGFETFLVDGYWRSAYLLPIYRRLLSLFGAAAAAPRRRLPHSRLMARLMATVGYHSVLAARRP